MEAVWKRDTQVERDKEFDLSASWSLVTVDDTFLFTDFFDDPDHILGRHTGVSGKYEVDQRVKGKYELEQKVSGKYQVAQRLDGKV